MVLAEAVLEIIACPDICKRFTVCLKEENICLRAKESSNLVEFSNTKRLLGSFASRAYFITNNKKPPLGSTGPHCGHEQCVANDLY